MLRKARYGFAATWDVSFLLVRDLQGFFLNLISPVGTRGLLPGLLMSSWQNLSVNVTGKPG